MIIDEFHKGCKERIEKQLEEAVRFNYDREPTLTAKSMRYEVAEKTEATIDVSGRNWHDCSATITFPGKNNCRCTHDP